MTYSLTTEETELLHLLRSIQHNNYEVPQDCNSFDLVVNVMGHLGCPDPELRDDLGYELLAQWIFHRQLFTRQQLHQLLTLATSQDMWFYRIDETDSISVLKRSFTSLVIALLLSVDGKHPFLTKGEWNHLLKDTCHYCETELDQRGYTLKFGWAHSSAHAADVLHAFANHPHCTVNDVEPILDAIQSIVGNSTLVYGDEEDERIARILVSLVQQKLITLHDLYAWFSQVKTERDTYIGSMHLRINWKHIFRSVQAQLSARGLLSEQEAEDVCLILTRFHPSRLYVL